jgi:PIN domain nuclease of toxin-antitoxin system
MNIIVDTNIVIHLADSIEKISQHHLDIIKNPNNSIYFSILSIAEISINKSINKLIIKDDILKMIKDMDIEILNFKSQEAMLLEKLPLHHKDPFDRMIICQAIVNNYPIITTDKKFSLYKEVALL